MGCGVGRRRSSDPAWLWLWRGPAATAPIRPLAWERPYAVGVALKKKKEKENRIVTVVLSAIRERCWLQPEWSCWEKEADLLALLGEEPEASGL